LLADDTFAEMVTKHSGMGKTHTLQDGDMGRDYLLASVSTTITI